APESAPTHEPVTPPAPPISSVPPVKTVAPLSGSKKAQVVLLLISCILFVDFGLFGLMNMGYTITMWATTIFYLIFACKGKNTFYSWSCISLALISTVVFALYNDTLILFALFNLYLILLSAALCDRFEVGKYSTGSFRNVADMFVLIFAYPFMAMGKAVKALFKREHKGIIHNKGVLTGLICAIPVIAIIVPLLISADAAFEKMFGFLKEISAVRSAFAVILGSIVFFFVYCHAYAAQNRSYPRVPRNTPQRTVLPTAALMSFTGAISLVYIMYIVSQLTYFFSAFIGETPADFLPAAYARRGFFEMCVICVINLGIMFFVILLSGRYKGKIQKPIAAICTFISMFSLLLIGTAQSKMYLYISRFGLTRMRVLTSVFMFFLATVFIVLILRLFITKMPYMRPLILIAALITITLGLVDVDATIARYNIEAYQSGKLSTIDTSELRSLGDGAVPYMIELLDDKDEKVRQDITDDLKRRHRALEFWADDGFDFRSYNYSKYRALRILNENAERIGIINQ
ncbi:MAG: DUF4173 domain-containing protein, partial [Clostridia bacterium]|nr:DUF4173 domain-containing protein [Clostridia bacterium]